jgi:threonine synthase
MLPTVQVPYQNTMLSPLAMKINLRFDNRVELGETTRIIVWSAAPCERLFVIAYCPTSNFRVPAEMAPLRCPLSGDPLEYTELPPFRPDRIDATYPGLWRYAAMLPVLAAGRERVTLGEGWTPLIRDAWRQRTIYWKFDALMPTGSYKDRGSSTLVNWLAGQEVETVVDDSSGNAGASLCCYASRAGLRALIFTPESAPEPKKAQIAIYGGELVEVPGPRDLCGQAAEAATRGSREAAYASHAWHPAFLLGMMTLAWEIWEQLGRKTPDWIVSPVGQGGLLLGIWRGFQHLQKSGQTQRLPRLAAVQAEPFTPIHDAFQQGTTTIAPLLLQEAISADGIAIGAPVRGNAVLEAVRQSLGETVSVSEPEVMRAHLRLARQGLFVEPTSATVAAALHRLVDVIDPTETVVAILTGHGLKRPLHEL